MEAVDFAKLAVVLAMAAAVVAVAAYDVFYGWPLCRRLRVLERQCEALGEALGGAPAEAAGAGATARLEAAEQRVREQLAHLGERLAQLELANQGVPYEKAIGLAEKGAEAERLLPYLGLSQSEADLVRLLHGGRSAA